MTMLVLALAVLAHAVLACLGIAHVVANERSVSTCAGWLAVCLLIPLLGPLLYALFGVRHMSLRLGSHAPAIQSKCHAVKRSSPVRSREDLVKLVDSIARAPLCGGNSISPLVNGASAYPEMIRAIKGAQHSIALSTYQFDYDDVGLQFCEALCSAADRGILVRVLVDFVGVWLHRSSSVVHLLRRGGVHAFCFNPPASIKDFRYINFRYHRKLLVVDGSVGFTGGMNIRAAHLIDRNLRRVNRDVHYRVEGPVVAQLQKVFAADWFHSAAEQLGGPAWFPKLVERGSSIVRGIDSGPDQTTRANYGLLLGVISCACTCIHITTPYFLPDESLLLSILTAARRGVEVRVIVSGDNFPIVHWAHQWVARSLVREGVRIFVGAIPFDHSKLMVVDSAWCFVGSSNWDPRSLAMNFEFDLEVHDSRLASWLEDFIDERIEAAQELTALEVENTSQMAVVRNGLARIGCSYL